MAVRRGKQHAVRWPIRIRWCAWLPLIDTLPGTDRAELRRGGMRVEITAQELRLLDVFLRNRGRVLSRAQLTETAWDEGAAITDRAVDTQVFNLRKKIDPVPAEPRFLLGARGLGYRFADEN